MSLDSCLIVCKEDPEVTIEQGTLRGFYAVDIHGKSFMKFKGIPYAKPPLGELRFKAPQPPGPWSDIFEAKVEGNDCYAPDPFQKFRIVGDEDCLYLNVYTKKLPDETNLVLNPVLFWIHGGGFTFGTSSERYYGPEFLLTQDVVLVTINYRVGLLGFLSFREPELDIPGNAGLKDQVMALKWVQKNIRAFGGDPRNVTVCGQDAGAASAHLMMLSPMTDGLFSKVIAQSGCALNPWVSCEAGYEAVAEAMGLKEADEKTIYEVLKDKSSRELLDIQLLMLQNVYPCEPRPLGVVAEDSDDPFLEEEPMDIILAGKYKPVPIIIGYNVTEGMMDEIVRDRTREEYLNFEDFIPWTFGYMNGGPKAEAVAKKIKEFYAGNADYTADAIKIKYDLITDCQVLQGLHLTIANTLHSPIFFYRLTLESRLNFFKKGLNLKIPGVAHFDDIGYLFKNFLSPEIRRGSNEDIYITRMVKMWTNFARAVVPTPSQDATLLECIWKVIQEPDLNYLEIGHHLKPGKNPDYKRILFWKELYEESPIGIDDAKKRKAAEERRAAEQRKAAEERKAAEKQKAYEKIKAVEKRKATEKAAEKSKEVEKREIAGTSKATEVRKTAEVAEAAEKRESAKKKEGKMPENLDEIVIEKSS